MMTKDAVIKYLQSKTTSFTVDEINGLINAIYSIPETTNTATTDLANERLDAEIKAEKKSKKK